MRSWRVVVVVAFIVGLSLFVIAGQNKFGVSDVNQVNFANPVRVGEVLLPAGNYEVRHTMKGEEHIMQFKQLGTKKPAQAEVKCTLVPLAQKAPHSEKTYILNAANQQVLHELVFRGDTAKHVF